MQQHRRMSRTQLFDKSRASLLRSVGLVLVAVLFAAACSSDGGGDSAPDSIKLGFHNMESGGISFSHVSGAAEAAAAEINARGGINGLDLELVVCGTDGSPESSTGCANRFVEEGVVAAVQGIDIGADAMLEILSEAGIIEVGFLPFTPGVQAASEDAAFFGSPVEGNAIAAMQLLEDLGVTNFALLLADLSNTRALYDTSIEPRAPEFGVNPDPTYFSADGEDWNLLMSQAVDDDTEAVITIGAADFDCTNMLRELRSIEFDGPIFLGACSGFIDVLGDDAVGAYLYSDFWWPRAQDRADEAGQQDIDTYLASMQSADLGAFANDGLAIRAYATIQNLAAVLATSDGAIDSASVTDSLRTAGPLDGFMGQSFSCDGQIWPGDSACSLGVVTWQVNDGLTLDMVSDGFIDLSEYRPAS